MDANTRTVKQDSKLFCQSPYVLSLLGTDKDPLNLHLYLEPVLGGPLHAHLRRRSGGHLAEETAALYTAEILAALAHMRERSCMHRDLKASNCLLDGAGHIKLSDFSAAKVVDADVAYSYTLIGTPEFMSPEMLLRDVGYTYASDIWSLGKFCSLIRVK